METAHSAARAGLNTYTQRFATANIGGHGVGSALGAWLLLAMIARDPNIGDDTRTELTDALGCDPGEAAQFADTMLGDPHPALATALASWSNPTLVTERHNQWSATLPAAVEHGPIPTQAAADQWAADHTFDLIDKFPVKLTSDTAMVLASAVATKISWIAKFEEVSAGLLDGGFAATATGALRADRQHRVEILEGPDGMFAAHSAESADGLTVTSVLTPDDFTNEQLWRAAGLAASHMAWQETTLRRVPLAELPLGDGAAWSITEQVETGVGVTPERYDTIMPAWSAQSSHTLTDSPGFAAAGRVMANWLALDAGPGSYEAKQSAVARYGAEGFEAAAVTAMVMRSAAMPRVEEMTVRTARIRFNRRYAVVATTRQARGRRDDGQWGVLCGEHWDGVPVFSAIVNAAD